MSIVPARLAVAASLMTAVGCVGGPCGSTSFFGPSPCANGACGVGGAPGFGGNPNFGGAPVIPQGAALPGTLPQAAGAASFTSTRSASAPVYAATPTAGAISYPQGTFPQGAFPQAGIPQPGIQQVGFQQPGYPQTARLPIQSVPTY